MYDRTCPCVTVCVNVWLYVCACMNVPGACMTLCICPYVTGCGTVYVCMCHCEYMYQCIYGECIASVHGFMYVSLYDYMCTCATNTICAHAWICACGCMNVSCPCMASYMCAHVLHYVYMWDCICVHVCGSGYCMCMRECMCMCDCMYACMCGYMSVCMTMCMLLDCVHTYVHVCVCDSMCTCVTVCVFTCVCMSASASVLCLILYLSMCECILCMLGSMHVFMCDFSMCICLSVCVHVYICVAICDFGHAHVWLHFACLFLFVCLTTSHH